ncbi:hypothetical protein [Endozoicomonas euniceicola]|uniref:Uncharacterized protein n=1 Tax=Endozoicomonas euniceicola TaxID=1234143 RepID=A0ABY6GT67_9GAMM|nr:hypothetical protein [Endozoicomonas euniceicola]UYM15184.1 hypothetical protein NX720_20325 [Endozoicomonas euniceicola]
MVIVTARLLQSREGVLPISKDQEQLNKYMEQQAELCRVLPRQTFYDLGSNL